MRPMEEFCLKNLPNMGIVLQYYNKPSSELVSYVNIVVHKFVPQMQDCCWQWFIFCKRG